MTFPVLLVVVAGFIVTNIVEGEAVRKTLKKVIKNQRGLTCKRGCLESHELLTF